MYCSCGNIATTVVEWFYHDGGHLEFEAICHTCFDGARYDIRFSNDRPRPEIIDNAIPDQARVDRANRIIHEHTWQHAIGILCNQYLK
jgi:hypothetical protein